MKAQDGRMSSVRLMATGTLNGEEWQRIREEMIYAVDEGLFQALYDMPVGGTAASEQVSS